MKKKFLSDRQRVLIGKYKTVNKTLKKLLWIAILWVILYDFILVNIPEWFPKASVLGLLARNICFAYLTGFIFYFLNAHLSSHKTKVKTYRYVANKVEALNSLSMDLILALKNSLGIPNENYDVPTLQDVQLWCQQIPSSSPAPFKTHMYTRTFPDWFTLFQFIDQETTKVVKDLLLIRDSLDSETLRLITNIENNTTTFLNMSRGILINTPNHNLAFFDRFIHSYRSTCKQLSSHLQKEYKVYKEEYHYLERKEREEKNA
ncbi:hypothetical protein [Priestia filamentosa]|uniref:hypothetical protein n=1 Tax=Priestia filamentosa TaxID=1402861 RepID=UPI003982900C